ncbi:MAG: ECF transporter S component [Nitrososphaeria archaeon]|nr:ECF transporter S component [Nitrososphaeria archaeon]NIN52289.1 ECF transporter S component [Nitrososphaeria archaeon]NIQ32767.1 ECF transporter S component [Nitrososphaeria archaeon]
MVTIVIALILIAFFFKFGSSKNSSKEIALVSILGAVSAAARVPFAAIPGIQPSTYLITCSGYVFGPMTGFMVGLLTPLISNFFLGHGPWTPYQMFAWGLVGVSASYVRRLKPGKRGLMVFSFSWGYFYGVIMNLWFWASFIHPLTFTTFIISLSRSFWFDTLHAIGNITFIAVLGMKTVGIFERYKKRFRVEIMKQLSIRSSSS